MSTSAFGLPMGVVRAIIEPLWTPKQVAVYLGVEKMAPQVGLEPTTLRLTALFRLSHSVPFDPCKSLTGCDLERISGLAKMDGFGSKLIERGYRFGYRYTNAEEPGRM